MSRNQLDRETSPYLLQHRSNPVHWRAWNVEALAEAKATGRPILLSVGYAACHWCHVMAHESFEDPVTAELMNRDFVPIKVDREERPDIDAIYQTALALMGEHGGWPLTMFLTPEAEPFWGGTYFPPEPRYGRPGFRQLLAAIAESYRAKPESVAANAAALREALRDQAAPTPGAGITLATLDVAAGAMLRMVDGRAGGMQGAPKFPQTSAFQFLWRAHWRSGDAALGRAVTLTLDRMCEGGIYDHLGGGFARYSTDAEWLVPHFEKMLYDNAGMIELLTLVWQRTNSPLYARRVAETVGWVLRDMIADHGAFAATIDADSEGEEGRYYVWSADEVADALPGDLGDLFRRVYDVSQAGNWEGHNILHRNHPGGRVDEVDEARLGEARAVLLELRSRRIPPARDDKVLADWNGMMIAALARAGFVFDRAEWIAAAARAFDAVAAHMVRDARLGHSLRAGKLQREAMLDDYAQMSRAALALYEATGEARFLAAGENWCETAHAHYRDAESGGYFFTADDAESLILRTKSAIDSAYPSGNAAMVETLARLWHVTGREVWRERAEAAVAAFAGELGRHFPSMCALLCAWELIEGAVKAAIGGAPGDGGRAELLRAVASVGQPNLMIAYEESRAAGAVICRGATCSAPLTDAESVRLELNRRLRG